MEKPREVVCGCCGKGTNNPHLLRLMEMVEKAEQRAKEQAESKDNQKGAKQ